jgi:2-succinyl-6-hydroxy-2,4-cyclohexadiene-1-carboxylate synthase
VIEERFVEVPSARTRVLERQGDRDPVVFLHGITSSGSTWTPFLTALPGGTRGVAFDTLGNGYTERSGPRRPITIEDQLTQLRELIEQLGIDRFAGVGHSMGCAPLLRLAWQEPGRLSGLLIEAPSALGRARPQMTMRIARYGPGRWLLERAANERFVRAQATKRLREFARREPDEELLEREAGHALANPKRQARGFVDLIGHTDPRAPVADVDRYRRIECPVWILRGSDDRDWMPESHEARYRALIPSARLIRWEGVGHAPHIQEPDRFGELLEGFLEATRQ